MIRILSRTIGQIWLNHDRLRQANYGLKLIRNKTEDFEQWAKEDAVHTDSLIWIIHNLRYEEEFKKIEKIFPLLTEVNEKNQFHYLKLVSLTKKVDFSEDFSKNIYKIIKENSSQLDTRTISNVLRALTSLKLQTIEKFDIIDTFSSVLIKDSSSFNTIDKSFIINGINSYPCESTFAIFKAFIADSSQKSIPECSSLCNFISIHPYVGCEVIFDYTENLILRNDYGVEKVFAQIVFSFSKMNKGSKKLVSYFILKTHEMQDSLDDYSIGVVINSLYRYQDIDREVLRKLDEVLVRQKGRINEKYLAEISKQLKIKIIKINEES